MRSFVFSWVAALLTAALLCSPQSAWAHGGGGGGGGHGGGGGFGGGGHGGGFGGGHMGGFGGGHMGGFGGGHMGGFSGGHYGGAPIGGFSGGHHSGFSGSSIGGMQHSGGISNFGSSPSFSGHHLGGSTLGGSSAIHHNPNSFTNRHVGGLTSGTGHNAVTQGFRGTSLTNHAGGMNAQSLLSHQAGSIGNHNAAFLQHHGGATTNLGGRSGLANNSGTAGGLHHSGLNNSGLNNNGMHHNGNGNRHNNNNNNNNGFFPFFGFFPFGFGGFGFGYPFYGLGYGYGGYGYGLGGYGLGGYGYGSGYYGYNPYGYYGSNAYATAAPSQAAAPASPTATDNAKVFAEKGENDFKAGNYKNAVYAWRHAAVDDPQNGVLMMMLGQALFANGQYDEAAGATQEAMQLLPEDQWGVVVKNFRELYGKQGDYTTQLRALEKEVKTNADNPATRFLLGFHYGYLGYPDHAVKQLDKTLKLAPNDLTAKKLREAMGGPKPGDQKPGDDKDGGDKAAQDGKAPDKPAAAKGAVDT